MFYILFGLPGAGKTYIGQLMQTYFGYTFYDGDQDLTDAIHDAIATKTPFTDEMRDEFFAALFASIDKRVKIHDRLVVAQTFIKERHREQALKRFPAGRFILVKTKIAIRKRRLADRVEMPLGSEYASQMVRNFDKPLIPHEVIHNNEQGESIIIPQLQSILQKRRKDNPK